jgi:topoisomerase-4 subunit A
MTFEEASQKPQQAEKEQYRTMQLSGMYENWFLDYASYVILERAVPEIDDGLKPVQRRLLHAMKQLDDGRFNKVANIIGHTMQYHPHGDASIGDALVQLGQKEIAVETQGNWGNVLTGDSAAASRYIEARLSRFANDVIFNPKTTNWKLSYDGRNKEPLSLPVKFPLLLAQGVEGIAVGLASKILPHNFLELIDACIAHLEDENFELVPDFPTGGMADMSRYNDGLRGGRIRIRAKIGILDRKTLIITEIPFSTTTGSLIDSIIGANDKGKIKIRKIDDNTAENVEIVVHLASGVSPDQTIDALYAFTQCELSISPNACVIMDGKPAFMGVSEILKYNAERTRNLLQQELEIRLMELEDDWHHASLEKIFIENRIYHDIEQCETWDAVLEAISIGLKPFVAKLHREITEQDIIRLTEIKIKRISKYNTFKADEHIKSLENEMEEVQNHLDNLTAYTIRFFEQIRKKHGKGRERKTEIRSFDVIEAASVAANNEKLYVNRVQGFIGTSLKKDEFVCECSDIDDIIVFRENGTYQITKVSAKSFIGENIIHVDVFRKNDDRTIYNVIYRDGKYGPYSVKRCAVVGVTRAREYTATNDKPDSKIVYFSSNPNGEAEIVRVQLRPRPKLKKTNFEYDFAQLAIRGRTARGNTLTRHTVRNITIRESGVSTLGAMSIWYDETVKRLNTDSRGTYLGDFMGDDKILILMKNGEFRLSGFDLSTHFDEDMLQLRKLDPEEVLTVIYIEGETGLYYLKRCTIEDDPALMKRNSIIGDHPDSRFIGLLYDPQPRLLIRFKENEKGRKPDDQEISVEDFIGEKSFKAKGKRLSNHPIESIIELDPVEEDIPEEESIPEDKATDEQPIAIEDEVTAETDQPKEVLPAGETPNKGSKPIQMELDF